MSSSGDSARGPLRVLTLVDYYLPGYKGGGPLRSIANLAEALRGDVQFMVITRDRDVGDAEPYSGVRPGEWQEVGGAMVFYAGRRHLSLRGLLALVRTTSHDVLYLNSLLSPVLTFRVLMLRRCGLLPRTPLVLAPRGEASPGALERKAFKKRSYLTLARLARLYDGVTWQASSEFEAEDIRARFQRWSDRALEIHVAPDVPTVLAAPANASRRDKTRGVLRVVFISRIMPHKNLAGAIDLLQGIRGQIDLTIHGPLEDPGYWEECQRRLAKLPPNVRAVYRGAIHPERVHEVLASQHLLLLPTFSENYGHVIFESLAAGTPVLVGDQTPWRGLEEKGVGWDLPLSMTERFRMALHRCVDMDQPAFQAMSDAAREFAARVAEDREVIERNRSLFLSMVK